MAGNLLDALKNAGLADAKKAKKIENEKKQQKHRELKRNEAHEAKGAASVSHDFVQVDARATEIDKAAARQNAEVQMASRLKQIYAQASITNAYGRKKFYFETPDRYIECMGLSDVAYALLDRGKYAIVSNENQDDFIVVHRAVALNLEAVDKKRVVVLHRQES